MTKEQFERLMSVLCSVAESLAILASPPAESGPQSNADSPPIGTVFLAVDAREPLRPINNATYFFLEGNCLDMALLILAALSFGFAAGFAARGLLAVAYERRRHDGGLG